MDLGTQQSLALARMSELRGVVFVTGGAGVGKSTVLNEFRSRHTALVVAPTGIAAINVGGTTVHSAFGLGIGPISDSKARKSGLDSKRRDLLRRIDALVIDEVSMVRADMMDAISTALRTAMDSGEPFGGKPVILIGDMWQLEPVVSDRESEWVYANYQSPFWFDAKCFGSVGLFEGLPVDTIEMTEVWRQSDPTFVDALNRLRVGDTSGRHVINTRDSAERHPSAVRICLTNHHAEDVNDMMLSQLPGEPEYYEAEIEGKSMSSWPSPAILELKVDARVMVTRNVWRDCGYVVNGATGWVRELHPIIVELDDGRVMESAPETWEVESYGIDMDSGEPVPVREASFTQHPLKLAWAITAHKSQGQTVDYAHLEMDRASFAHGQTYVALSRVRSLNGLSLRRSLRAADIIIHPRVAEFCGNNRINQEAFA